MRLSTAHLDHLIVPPTIQRARHREFHRRMLAPPSLTRPPEAEPEPEPPPPPEQGTMPEPAATDRPIRGTDEEYLRWMRSEFLRKRFAQPYLRPVLIARAVGARAFGVTIREMISDDRRWPLVHNRGKTMAFAKVVTGASTPDVGRAFKRDHTTVLNAMNNFGDLVRRALSGAAE